MGGNSATSCEANFGAWQATIPDAPVLLDYELAPISDLVADPDVKASLEAAVVEYVKEQRAKWATANKCPVNCGKQAGSCDSTGHVFQWPAAVFMFHAASCACRSLAMLFVASGRVHRFVAAFQRRVFRRLPSVAQQGWWAGPQSGAAVLHRACLRRGGSCNSTGHVFH